MSDNCFDNVGDVTYIDLRHADLTDLEKREQDLEQRHAKLEDEFKKMKKRYKHLI